MGELSSMFDWRRGTLADAIMYASEWSSRDPDAPHPTYIRELLRTPWPEDPATLARTLPSIDQFVTEWELAEVAAANVEASQASVQLALVIDEAPEHERITRALGKAYTALGRVPTLRDVQRRRVGLPAVEEFDAVGGFRSAVRRFKAEVGVA